MEDDARAMMFLEFLFFLERRFHSATKNRVQQDRANPHSHGPPEKAGQEPARPKTRASSPTKDQSRGRARNGKPNRGPEPRLTNPEKTASTASTAMPSKKGSGGERGRTTASKGSLHRPEKVAPAEASKPRTEQEPAPNKVGCYNTRHSPYSSSFEKERRSQSEDRGDVFEVNGDVEEDASSACERNTGRLRVQVKRTEPNVRMRTDSYSFRATLEATSEFSLSTSAADDKDNGESLLWRTRPTQNTGARTGVKMSAQIFVNQVYLVGVEYPHDINDPSPIIPVHVAHDLRTVDAPQPSRNVTILW